MQTFTFNGKENIKDMNCFVTSKIKFPIAEEIIESVAVEGSDVGSYTIKSGSYNNIELEMNIKIYDKTDVKEQFKKVKRWLTDIQDHRLTFDKKKCYFVKRVLFTGYYFDVTTCNLAIKFICEPLLRKYEEESRILNSGNSVTLTNEGDAVEIPLIIVDMVGRGNTTISVATTDRTYNNTMKLMDIEGRVTINSPLKEVYDANGQSLTLKTMGDFFRIPNGKTYVLAVSGSNIRNVKYIRNERFDC